MIKYQNLGAGQEVTGSCHYLEMGGLKILVDFGMVQDSSKSIEELYALNSRQLPVKISEIDYVVVLHAHLDHVGRVGTLPVHDFKGRVIATELTAEIMNLNLADAAYLHGKEVERMNKRRKKNKVLPILSTHTVDTALSYVRGYGFNQEIVLNDKVTLELLPASHLSGAAMGLFTYREGYEVKRVLFTSDTGGKSRDIPFTMKPNLEKMKISAIITEATYGDIDYIRTDIEEQLVKHIQETCIENNATIVSPVFSIGRSTNMLYYLKRVYEKNKQFDNIPIYLASPMAIRAHSIIGKRENFVFYDDTWKDHADLWMWGNVTYIDNFDDVKSKLCNGNPKILLSSSGMIGGGYSNFLVSNYLPHKHSKILLTGYQAEGTAGRRLLDGNNKTINIDNKPIKIKAKIDKLEGLSGHATGKELVEMFSEIEKKKLKNIIITHGDYDKCLELKAKLEKEFQNVEIHIPKYGDIIKI